MNKIALIAGGTGLVGRHLVDLLVEANEFEEIKVLVRKGSKHQFKGVSVLEVDYDHLSESKSQLIADVVFCCLGTTMKKAGSKEQFRRVDFTYPYELAKLSHENGCKQFNIITASGANSNSMFYYNRVKGEVEAAISEIKFKSVNIFQPSLLLGERDEERMGEKAGEVLAKVINPFLIGGFKKYRAIQAKTVAYAMLAISLESKSGVHILPSDLIQKLGSK
jgi:uncharacterized protein YbjT (DUF2867 family)